LVAVTTGAFLTAGILIGASYRPHNPFSESTIRAVAVVAALLAVVSFLIGVTTSSGSDCGGTDCDTGYGIGSVLLIGVYFAGLVPGALLGRRMRRHNG
jgi:Ca2+/H+ antiporter